MSRAASRSSSDTPRGRGRGPSSALARVGSVRPRSIVKRRTIRDIFAEGRASTTPRRNVEAHDSHTAATSEFQQDLRPDQAPTMIDARTVHVQYSADQRQIFSADPQVVAEASQAVASARIEAQQQSMEAQRATVEIAQQAQRYTSELTNEARQAVTQVERNAQDQVRAMEDHLRAHYEQREAQLLAQLERIAQSQASMRNVEAYSSGSPLHGQNDAGSPHQHVSDSLRVLQDQVNELVHRQVSFEVTANEMWREIRHTLEDLSDRVSSLESWYEETSVHEVVRLTSPDGTPINRGGQSVLSRDGSQTEQDHTTDQLLEDQCLRWKDVTAVRLPSLPESAGALRQWRNTVLPMFMSLDRSEHNHLANWLMKAFHAKTKAEILQRNTDSEGFPRFDRVLCSWFSKPECLKGHFGTKIQAYLEEAMNSGLQLRGRPLLNMVVREFDLDAALGGVVSAVELFQIPSPEHDSIPSLQNFRDKVQYILGQIPVNEKPVDSMLAKWLFERLKRVKFLQLTIDRIRESPSEAHERTYEYLWARMQRAIAESQHDKNLQSIQEGLRKGPNKKPRLTGAASSSKDGGKGKGKSEKGKEKGKGSSVDEKKER